MEIKKAVFGLKIILFKQKFEKGNYKDVWRIISKRSISIVCQNPQVRVNESFESESFMNTKSLFDRSVKELEEKANNNAFSDVKIEESEGGLRIKCYALGG